MVFHQCVQYILELKLRNSCNLYCESRVFCFSTQMFYFKGKTSILIEQRKKENNVYLMLCNKRYHIVLWFTVLEKEHIKQQFQSLFKPALRICQQ